MNKIDNKKKLESWRALVIMPLTGIEMRRLGEQQNVGRSQDVPRRESP
jgi:hypothetical protein